MGATSLTSILSPTYISPRDPEFARKQTVQAALAELPPQASSLDWRAASGSELHAIYGMAGRKGFSANFEDTRVVAIKGVRSVPIDPADSGPTAPRREIREFGVCCSLISDPHVFETMEGPVAHKVYEIAQEAHAREHPGRLARLEKALVRLYRWRRFSKQAE